MNERTKQRRLSFARNQFEISKMQAMYWCAMATTGAATLRNTSQGREPTPEEKAAGQVMGYREHTDLEKINNALETMQNHIRRMNETNDYIDELLEDKPSHRDEFDIDY